ncbi:GNAT family N-acetyltransferase [Frankia canadensis]|nr:GNAT family N-acetyltransferase [Frankia canadensis]
MTHFPQVEALSTPRLLLRRWRPEDEAAIAEMNRDPQVARYLNRPVDPATVEAFLGRMVQHWQEHGYGPWILESHEPDHAGEVLGFAGLAHVPPFLAAAGSRPELGWRLCRAAWGRGLATEAARAARDDAFERLGLPDLISVIHPENARSQRVAGKLGLRPTRRIHNPLLDREVDVWTQSATDLRA